jgi:DNA-binding NtrC family response regulator
MHEGCRDVIDGPLDEGRLAEVLDAFVPSHEVATADSATLEARSVYRIAGKSPRLLEAVATAKKVAATSVPVLVTGESGTGKELVSLLIHHHSRRRGNPYVAVNCGALSESLLESELFGHEKGAFTGAHERRVGRFERAHGGTLLLDEISETNAGFQAELLRVLEQQHFERVGGSDPIRVNVRVISTSNRDLAADVARGRFRRDLYYRLCGVRIHLPPLRERKEDIPILVWHFVNRYAGEVERRVERLDPEMMEAFARHRWPGNVRQLCNVVRAALILGEGETLSLEESPALWHELRASERAEPATLSLAELERRAIFEALRRTKSHQARAADLLGITDRTLREKLRRYRREGHVPAAARGEAAEPLPAGDRQWAMSRT